MWGKQENCKITVSQVTLYEDPDFSFSLWCSETSSVVYWRSLIIPVLEKQRLLDERVGGHGANILPCKALSSFCLGGTATMSKDVPWVGSWPVPVTCTLRYTLENFQSCWICWLTYSKCLSFKKDQNVEELSLFHVFLDNHYENNMLFCLFVLSLTLLIL